MGSLFGDSDEFISGGGGFGGRGSQRNSGNRHGGNGAIVFCVVCLCLGTGMTYGLTYLQNLSKNSSSAKSYSKIDYNYEPKYKLKSCETDACKNAAQEVISSLNPFVDPCENFYEYACQGWQCNNPRPSYSPDWTVFHKLQRNTSEVVSEILSNSTFSLSGSTKPYNDLPALKLARNFYQDCMRSKSEHDDKAIYNVMLNSLNEHGGWPLLQNLDSWDSSKFDLIKAMVAMKRRFDSPIFLDITSVQDPSGKMDKNSIYISRPSPLGSLINVVKPAEEKALDLVHTLRDFIVNVSKELLIFQGKTNINTTYLEDKAWEIIAVEVELQQAAAKKVSLFYKRVYGINPLPIPVKTNVSELQGWLDMYTYPFNNFIQISDYVLQLYNPILYGGVTQAIEVSSIDYVMSVSKLISELKQESLANYIMFQMVSSMIPFSTQKMQDHFSVLKHALHGTTGEKPRTEVCTALTQQKFSLAVGHAFIQNTVFEHFYEVKTMFDGIKQAFIDLLLSSYMQYNKESLIDELYNTNLCLGYPYFLSDKKKVQSEYNGLSLHQSTFLEKLMSVNNWLTTKQLSTITEKWDLTDNCKWTRFAGTVGAFNKIPELQVYLPLGMLQSPFYNVDLPMALNYGALGSILGHEITHGLVGPGWLILNTGSLTPFSECLVNQYGDFSTPELKKKNLTVNGLLTLKENIPDNAGLIGAYKAYKKELRRSRQFVTELEQFSEDQLFFLGFAQNWCHSSTPEGIEKTVKTDVHSPGKFRVLGALQNSKEFATAWNCSVGSKMNPSRWQHQKCTFF